MYSLHLTCRPEDVEQLSFLLWEAGTAGLREEDRLDGIELIAGFDDSIDRDEVSARFPNYHPVWEQEEPIDWVSATQEAWPGRDVGNRIYLAPMWNKDATPEGRVRVVHNPGLASGTGEHPCTQLALESLESHISNDLFVVDVGTGSGLLAIAALKLGAHFALGLDTDVTTLPVARENFLLNELPPTLAAGSADCLAAETANVVVANISATVLIALADDLLRIAKPNARLILTGFPESELGAISRLFGAGEVTALNQWRCVTLIS